MKKTSLILAVGALLYGTSGTYATAEVISIEEATQILSNLVIEPVNEPGEDADVDTSLGTDSFTIPSYVTIVDEPAVYRHSMCPESFQVDGGEMAEFPVTVTFGDGSSETVMWEINPASPIQVADPSTETEFTGGWARGTGWLLAETGDTWYTTNPWVLYTAEGVSITSIKLEPITPIRNGGKSYTFDIGGKNRYTNPPDPQHTPGSSNGRVITLKRPPQVKFEATYSHPVYVGNHDPDSPHDLYGVLEIQFVNNSGNPIAIGGATAIDVVDFAYIADTDCLPVREAKIDSYDASSGIVNLTLLGSGLSYIQESCPGEQPSAISGATFDVQSRAQVSAVVMPMSGCCYSLVDVDTLQNVRLLGVDGPGNSADEVCMP